jgi:ectoine hydroxylase
MAACATPVSALDARLELLAGRGLVTLQGVLDDASLRRLTAAVDRVYEQELRRGGAAADGSLHLLEFLGRDPSFLALLDLEPVLELVAACLGWNIQVYHSHLDVHPPLPAAAPWRWRWHQDGGRQHSDLGRRARLSLKVCFVLSDLSEPGRGNMLVLPGSQQLRRLSLREADPPGAVPVLAAPGTAVVFDPRLWHARGENRSQITRKLLFLAYGYRWLRPRGSPLDELAGARLSPLRRQLLGGAVSQHGHWFPTADDVPLRAWLEARRKP